MKIKAGQVWKHVRMKDRILKVVKVTKEEMSFVWKEMGEWDTTVRHEKTMGDPWHDENHPSYNPQSCFLSNYTLDKRSILKEILDATK